jgi:uncharacterized protein YfaS (alpha-2-macroglobulin family)
MELTLRLLVGWFRGFRAVAVIGGFVFLASADWSAAAPAGARIERFSPQGSVRAVRQVAVDFSQPMTPFGDVRQPDPFEIDCPEPGHGRWADDRTWIYDFDRDLPGGIACRFSVKPGVKDLAGRGLRGQRRFAFDTGGPLVLDSFPEQSADIREKQVFVLALDAEPDIESVLAHTRCLSDQPKTSGGIELLSGEARRAALEGRAIDSLRWQLREDFDPLSGADQSAVDRQILVLRCHDPWPTGARVRLVLGKGLRSIRGVPNGQEQALPFRVRPELQAELKCRPLHDPTGVCHPGQRMTAEFNAPIPAEQAGRLVLTGAGESIVPQPIDRARHPSVQTVTFPGPFTENQSYRLLLTPDLVDEDGRTVKPPAGDRVVKATGEFPVRVEFPQTFSILERGADAVLPVTVHNARTGVVGRWKKVTPSIKGSMPSAETDKTIQDIAGWLERIDRRQSRGYAGREAQQAAEAPGSVFAGLTITQPFTLEPTRSPGIGEVRGIKLEEPGFYVVEAESRQPAGVPEPERPQPAVTSVLVTNLGVHFKHSGRVLQALYRGPALIWVTALDTGAPVGGAEVAIHHPCSGTLLWEGRTDEAGVARVDSDALSRADSLAQCEHKKSSNLVVSARTDDDFSFVTAWRDELYGTWNGRDQYQGQWSAGEAITATALDRSLFKPGETVHMKHWHRTLETEGVSIPAAESPAVAAPPTLSLRHQGSDETVEFTAQFDAQGVAESSWSIPLDAKLGRYEVTIPGPDDHSNETSAEFDVAEFRLPTMTGRVEAPRQPLVNVGSVNLKVSAAYLDGSAAARWPVAVRTALEPRDVEFPGYEDYRFGGGDSGDEADTASTEDKPQLQHLSLNQGGSGQVAIAGLRKASTAQDLVAELDFQDANGEQVSVASRIALWPAKVVLGIKSRRGMLRNDRLHLEIVALDLQGQPVAGQAVTVDLFEGTLQAAFTDPSTRPKLLGQICNGTTDANGILSCEASVPVSDDLNWCQIRVRTRDGDGNESRAALSNVIINYSKLANLESDELKAKLSVLIPDQDRRFEVKPEQPLYQPEDTARLRVKMPFERATALVTVERDGVIDQFTTALNGEDSTIDIPLKAAYAPNVFVSVLAVHGRLRDAGPPGPFEDAGKPAARVATAMIKVAPQAYQLDVAVQPEQETYRVRDRAKVRIAVRPAHGDDLPVPAEVAIAVVDEALLELKPNPSWRLLDRLMEPRALSVETASAVKRVLGRRRWGPVSEGGSVADAEEALGKLDRMFKHSMKKGGYGDVEGIERNNAVRANFDSLLLWQGRVALDGDGEAELEVPLNDALTRFRIVAMAHAGADRFGTGEATIRTTQEVALFSGLPPAVHEGDEFDAQFSVRNTGDGPVSLELNAAVSVPGAAPLEALRAQPLQLQPGATAKPVWRVRVPAGAERLNWEISVRDQNGSALDALKAEQRVLPVTPVRVQQATLARIDRPYQLPLQRPSTANPNRGGVTVSLLPSLAADLGGLTSYMAAYPLDCLEQRVSKAVALRDLVQWRQIMNDLPRYLDDDGLLRYFPRGGSAGSDSLTAYVLALANQAGWSLPEESQERLLAGLKDFVAGKTIRPSFRADADGIARRLAAVEALTRYGQGRSDMLAGIAIRPNEWPTSALLDWIGILQRQQDIGKREQKLREAQRILWTRINLQDSAMAFSSERRDRLWWLMVSSDLNAARAILALLDQPERRKDLPRLVRGALLRQDQGHWDTTTANAWGRLALERFGAVFEAEPVAGRTEAVLGAASQTADWQGNGQPADLELPWPPGRDRLTVSHRGSGAPWAVVTSRAALPLSEPLFTGYAITRSVVPVEQRRPGQWSPGDVARVRLEIDAQTDMTWVAVTDPIPAGASILGTGLGRDSDLLTAEEQQRGWVRPEYEERRFDGFRAYYRFVPKGRWTLEYTVRFNQAGRFHLPATRVEAMYLPEMFGELPNAPVEVTSGAGGNAP